MAQFPNPGVFNDYIMYMCSRGHMWMFGQTEMAEWIADEDHVCTTCKRSPIWKFHIKSDEDVDKFTEPEKIENPECTCELTHYKPPTTLGEMLT